MLSIDVLAAVHHRLCFEIGGSALPVSPVSRVASFQESTAAAPDPVPSTYEYGSIGNVRLGVIKSGVMALVEPGAFRSLSGYHRRISRGMPRVGPGAVYYVPPLCFATPSLFVDWMREELIDTTNLKMKCQCLTLHF